MRLYFCTQLSHDGITHCVYSCIHRIRDDLGWWQRKKTHTALTNCNARQLGKPLQDLRSYQQALSTDDDFILLYIVVQYRGRNYFPVCLQMWFLTFFAFAKTSHLWRKPVCVRRGAIVKSDTLWLGFARRTIIATLTPLGEKNACAWLSRDSRVHLEDGELHVSAGRWALAALQPASRERSGGGEQRCYCASPQSGNLL